MFRSVGWTADTSASASRVVGSLGTGSLSGTESLGEGGKAAW